MVVCQGGVYRLGDEKEFLVFFLDFCVCLQKGNISLEALRDGEACLFEEEQHDDKPSKGTSSGCQAR
jgi:hypothetical protein